MTCKDCKHARWMLTPKGRIKRDTCGECVAPWTPPVLPPFIRIDAWQWKRRHIFPEGGESCPLYEKSEEKPKAIS